MIALAACGTTNATSMNIDVNNSVEVLDKKLYAYVIYIGNQVLLSLEDRAPYKINHIVSYHERGPGFRVMQESFLRTRFSCPGVVQRRLESERNGSRRNISQKNKLNYVGDKCE